MPNTGLRTSGSATTRSAPDTSDPRPPATHSTTIWPLTCGADHALPARDDTCSCLAVAASCAGAAAWVAVRAAGIWAWLCVRLADLHCRTDNRGSGKLPGLCADDGASAERRPRTRRGCA